MTVSLTSLPTSLSIATDGVGTIDSLMVHTIEEFSLVGAVVAIGTAGEVPEIHTYGLANPATGRVMTAADRFKIASLSKPVTAEAILVLVRQGRLGLDDRLVEVLPGTARSVDDRVATIELRHLLQHSAGWDRSLSIDPFFATVDEIDELLNGRNVVIDDCVVVADAMLERPLQFDPGSRFAYSNLGYCWLGRVLEDTVGTSYEDAVHALVPETVGMSLDETDVTVRYQIVPSEEQYLTNRPDIVAPAGGWIADAAQYFRFASRPIDPTILEQPPFATENQHFGLGWRVWDLDERTVLTHYGAMPGVFSVVIRHEQGPLFVALFNGRPPNDEETFRFLLDAILTLPAWQ
ncbi:MAG: serine hydrolase domain-containing protein [Pseudomonadota bacterium]